MARNIDKEEKVFEEVIDDMAVESPVVETAQLSPKKKQYKVISWNPKSNMIVLERDGKYIQSNCIEYDGTNGYIEI